MARKLKVFRTSIGFHDAYVAVPSQKAALQAWGSSSNLFGTGLAEEVVDPKLMKAPLATPGEVIKVKRGSEREHLAALPRPAKSGKIQQKPGVEPRKPGLPRPSRNALERAEKAVTAAEAARDKQLDAIDNEIRGLQQRRRQVADRHRKKIDILDDKRAVQADRYDAAITAWRDQES